MYSAYSIVDMLNTPDKVDEASGWLSQMIEEDKVGILAAANQDVIDKGNGTYIIADVHGFEISDQNTLGRELPPDRPRVLSGIFLMHYWSEARHEWRGHGFVEELITMPNVKQRVLLRLRSRYHKERSHEA